MISKHWAFLLLSVTGSASAFAQTKNDSTGKQLDQVIVTATKYPVKQSQTGKVIIVISHEEIEKSAGKPLGELLGEQAGIIVSGSLNNPGTNQSIFIRGAGSGRTLVLIDGIPVSDPTATDNSFDINLIPVTMIERIEISKGAQSTLYGSDAIAGVINIITIKSDVKYPFNVKASLSGGNYGTSNANAQVFGKVADRLTYNVRYNHDHSNGFATTRDTFKTAPSPVPFLHDGFKSDLVAANIGWNATSSLSIKGFLQYSQYTADIDAGAFAPAVGFTSTTRSLLAGGGFTYKLANTTITGNYRYSTAQLHLLEDSVDGQSYYTDHYVGASQYVEMFASTNLGYGFTLLNGADYRYASMHESGTYGSFSDTSVSQTSMYSSLLYTGKSGLSAELGGRLNTDSRYGSNYTYTFNPAWLIGSNWKIYGSIATAFKAPTLYQLYSPYGDANLLPEKSSSYEGGIQFNSALPNNTLLNTRVTYFHRNTKDGIDYNFFTNQYYNYDEEWGNGIEWEGSIKFAKTWSLNANYTWTKMKQQTQSHVSYDDTTYDYALRVPQHTVNITLGVRPVKDLYLGVTGHYESKRFDIGGYDANYNPLPDVVLNPFLIFNGYAEYKVVRFAKIFIECRNILDKKFTTVYGFNSIPTMFTAGGTIEL